MLEVKDWSFNVGKGYIVKVVKDDTMDSFQVTLKNTINYVNSWVFNQDSNMMELGKISREILRTAKVKDHETINAFVASFIQMNSVKPFVNYMGDKLIKGDKIIIKAPAAAVAIDEGPAVILDSEELYQGDDED